MKTTVKIEKRKLSPAQAKDMENALATAERTQAFMDYIAVCDHPELLEEEHDDNL